MALQVSFPSLNDLAIYELASITKIWDIEGIKLLPCQLRSLHISHCPKVEEIFSVPEKVKETSASNNGEITFSTLEILWLKKLPNFKKFYSSMSEGQYLFNHQVSTF